MEKLKSFIKFCGWAFSATASLYAWVNLLGVSILSILTFSILASITREVIKKRFNHG
jgi:hypothetical protein